MSTVAKGTLNGGPSIATTVPSHNHMIGPIGDGIGVRGGLGSGAGQRLGPVDFCYITSSGIVLPALEDQTGTTAAVNDVQTMYATLPPGLSTSIASGTYVIGYKGVYPAPFVVGTDTNSTVQTALRAISSIGGANVTVTGTFPNFVFTAAGSFAGTALDLFEVQSNLLSNDGSFVVLGINHTTMGQPIGNSGAEQAQSRVRGITIKSYIRGEPVTLYDAVIVYYSDGLLTPGADYYLSGTVPGGLDTAPTLAATVQKSIAFALDTQRLYVKCVQ